MYHDLVFLLHPNSNLQMLEIMHYIYFHDNLFILILLSVYVCITKLLESNRKFIPCGYA